MRRIERALLCFFLSTPGLIAQTGQACPDSFTAKVVMQADALIRCLEGPTRRYAVFALGNLGDSGAVKPLITLLHDGDYLVQSDAAEALGRLGDKRAVEPLIPLLRHREGLVRSRAARALGKLGDERAVEPLIPLLQDGNGLVRSGAAEALGKLGDKRAVEPLIPLLQDGHPVRWFAAEALGRLGDKRAMEPLVALLKDVSAPPLWRARAADVLASLSPGLSVDGKSMTQLKGQLEQAARGNSSSEQASAAPGEIRETCSVIRQCLPKELDKNAIYSLVEKPSGVFRLIDTIKCPEPGLGGGVGALSGGRIGGSGGALLGDMMVACGSIFVRQDIDATNGRIYRIQ